MLSTNYGDKHMLQDPYCYEKGNEFQKEINGGIDPNRIKKENLTKYDADCEEEK